MAWVTLPVPARLRVSGAMTIRFANSYGPRRTGVVRMFSNNPDCLLFRAIVFMATLLVNGLLVLSEKIPLILTRYYKVRAMFFAWSKLLILMKNKKMSLFVFLDLPFEIS